VVCDEAQNIKNPSTKAAQTARALPARWRAALTGTPVENRLADLWSIFQFLNPGYLGSEREFRTRMANPIERLGDQAATRRLHALTGPFILRRLKSDKSIIADLPDPRTESVQKLYTREFYQLVRAHLAPGGYFVTQATSPFYTSRAFWCIAATARAVWPDVAPLHVDVPSFGSWGFVLAGQGPLDVSALRVTVAATVTPTTPATQAHPAARSSCCA